MNGPIGDKPSIHGTQLLPGDARDVYRQKLARITLDSMVQFVGLLDVHGTVLEINKVALDAVGIKLSEVEGRPFWTTFWWQVSEEINQGLRDMIARAAAGEFVRWDTPIYGRAGGKETIIIDASLMPVYDDEGKVVFIAAEGRDITEKKAYEREIARQREELATLDKLKTEFFANISHEFRTPLTLMLGPLEDALADPALPEGETRARIQLAHRNALRQFKLVNTLLDFSRIEAGRIQASYEQTDLSELTSELASVWRSAIERAGLTLTVDCERLDDAVFIDREMWEKIVLNLLSNAFKFTFAGEIRVKLNQTPTHAVLSVIDSGTGIAAEELPRIFDRFHRVKGVRGRSFEGSGIGLALVRELVHLHGGTVEVESEPGRGSRFRVSIPFGREHLPADRIDAERTLSSTAARSEAYVQEALHWLPDTAVPREAPEGETSATQVLRFGLESSTALSASQRAGRQVLVVDDNADMRDYVSRLLRSVGYQVQGAANGLAALDAARAQLPDVILSDIMMPLLDGFGLLREVRLDLALRQIPFVMLSARAGEEARIEGLEAGADDYLIKPFSGRELIARVDSQLSMAQLRRESTRALGESEKRFRALVTASSDVVYRMSPDWSELRYLEGREFILDTREPNTSWVDKYIPLTEQPRVLEGIRVAVGSKTPFELEHRVTQKDGTVGWTFSRAIPILDASGEIVEWLGMATDITQRKRLEDSLRDADRRKDEFLATLAHELRNPLAPIRNAVHLLRRAQVDEATIRSATEIVNRQVQHMVRLIDDLMEVSRITLGQITLRRETVSVRNVLMDALEVVTPAIDAKGHALSIDLAQEDLRVNADPTRLSQVFQNLLHNAAKYTPQGGRIALSSKRSGSSVRISVRDSGLGIAPQHHGRVFELFTRVHPDDKLKTSGLGIGLALARQLVGLQGGTVELSSDGLGNGSEFIVTLPLSGAALEPADAAAPAGLATLPSGKSVLIVDDNLDAARSLALLLQMDGHTVHLAPTGHDALKLFLDLRPEVVLLDIGLPDIDGYEVARRIRRSDDGRRTLLIALTGWGQAQDKARAAHAGFDEHLSKPADPEVVRRLLTGTASSGRVDS